MVAMTSELPVAVPHDGLDPAGQAAAIARIHDLYSGGDLSLDRLFETLEGAVAASGHAELEAVMSGLPPLVRLTPPSRRLHHPLVLRVADGRLRLGPGWQLAAHTTVATGFGAGRIDLTAATWDDLSVELALSTWGSIEVLVPHGVAVRVAGQLGRIRLDPLCPPVPGGPVLSVSVSGPAGSVRVRHPRPTVGGTRRRRRFRRDVTARPGR